MILMTPDFSDAQKRSRPRPQWRLTGLVCLVLLMIAGTICPAGALTPNNGPQEVDHTEATTRARSAMLSLASAMQDEAFVLRDSYWSGLLQPQESRIIFLQLLEGVDYWFSTGWSSGDGKVRLGIYDNRGNLLLPEKLAEAHQAIGARVEPIRTAPYYVRLTNVGSAPAMVCLTYCYR